MKRSVRNGIAIAGMAGGMWLLGQAVASADEVATPSADTTVTQTDSGGGSNANLSSNNASASNEQQTKVDTDVTAGDGGINDATVNTGVIQDSGPVLLESSVPNGGPGQHHESTGTTVTLDTGDVSVNQQANGGDVNGSGNVAVAGSGNQTATATATTTVDQTSTGEDNHHGNEQPRQLRRTGGPRPPEQRSRPGRQLQRQREQR